MKKIFLEAMSQPFDLSTMLARIDRHHIIGNLTDEEREELAALAREKANPAAGLDVMAKLLEIEARLKALEEGKAGSGTDGAGSAPEYTAGHWYYGGDKVTYKGTEYVCIAPEDTVCVWNPDEYPLYWEKV